MARIYRKDDVSFHSDGFRPGHPAVNVKVRRFAEGLDCDDLVKLHGCSKDQAEKALEWAFNMAQREFWECVQDWAEECLGDHVKAYSEGRSSGWVVVYHLPDFETWDAVQLAKWRRFEAGCLSHVRDLCKREVVLESIEANRWAEDGAEEYNFVHRDNKPPVCMVEVNKAKREAVEKLLAEM